MPGLIMVNTGDGKGKTTAALGLAFRALGQGQRVLVIQFMKAPDGYGEIRAADLLGDKLEIRSMGCGFLFSRDPEIVAKHKEAAQNAFQAAANAIMSGEYFIVVLDEINYAVHYELLQVDNLVNLLRNKPSEVNVVLTGRNAHSKVIEIADMVTEMRNIKHHFEKDIQAQKGIEY